MEDTGHTFVWQKEHVLDDWQEALRYARQQLSTSKTNLRVQFLQENLLPLAKREDLSLEQILDIFKLLTETYPRYIDNLSREAVEAVGAELVRVDEIRAEKLGVSEQVLGWISSEVKRIQKRASSYAPADMFVLLSWCAGLYEVCLKHNQRFTISHSWNLLVSSLAVLLELLLNPTTHAKSGIQKSALVRTRHALRSVSRNILDVVNTLLSISKSSSSPLIYVPLLGISLDVTLRLKNIKDLQSTTVPNDIKGEIISLYTNRVLMARSQIPGHITVSLHSFIQILSEADFKETILPIMEKALLRSPECALGVISDFFLVYTHPIDVEIFGKILTPALNCSKSANPQVRGGSITLFKVVIERKASDESKSVAVTELLNLAKAGKAMGPDRQILYTMLGFLSPSTEVSSILITAVPAILAKETNEVAAPLLGSALTPHLVFYMKENKKLPSDVTALLIKEMQNTKPAVRRVFVTLVGGVFWELGEVVTEVSQEFAKATMSAFEASLRAMSTNPTSDPLESYVALSILLGPFSKSNIFQDVISRNPSIQAIASPSKSSFLLSDKVYQKLASIDEEEWLLRAVESTLTYFHSELITNEYFRTQLGLTFLHLAVDNQNSSFRKRVITALEHQMALFPSVVNMLIRDALRAHISRAKPSQAKVQNGSADDEKPLINKQPRFIPFLYASGSFSNEIEASVRQDLLSDFVVLGHHPLICGDSRQAWIELCRRARVDPQVLVNQNFDKLFTISLNTSDEKVLEAMSDDNKEAGYRAITTMAFVSPGHVLPRLMEQLRSDLDCGVKFLSDVDFAIWATPEGTMYTDVLSSQNARTIQAKGKNTDIAKWEAEVRKSVAAKKSVSVPTLSKQEQALVNAQLEKEAEIRSRVQRIKISLDRGFQVIRHLLSGNVQEFRDYVYPVTQLLLDSGSLDKGYALLGRDAFDTYLSLSKCCTERLETFKPWIGVATLRGCGVAVIPEELQAEPVKHLILRVLYRLYALSEQTPLDLPTFSYAFPLVYQVLMKGSIGLQEEEDSLEQVALSLNIIKYHCGEFSNRLFPRLQVMEALIHSMRRHLKLSKEASTVLVDFGQAIYTNASKGEITLLLQSTLSQEAHARTSCLQSLQPFDLTELDWSPELLIAAHDDDEQNARLARHIWDDNGLDIPEAWSEDLLKFLDHENVHVRTSVASAIVEAVEHWPQSISQTVNSLKDLYREKARILAPEFDQYGLVIEQSLNRTDSWQARLATADTFRLLAPLFSDGDTVPFFEFLIRDGALGDSKAEVRRGMLDAGTTVIDYHGSAHLAHLISIFEKHLSETGLSSETEDFIQEAVAILFGRVARHLDSSDPRLPKIISRLVEALRTPSEQVQFAVSDCLAPLVQITRDSVPSLVSQLFEELFNAPKYSARRGAAYGLAGIIKGIGLSSFKEFDVLNRLRNATEDKKRYEPRQGAMFTLETLSVTLGRLFEPYAIHVLPLLLNSFGDTIPDVREAATDAARIIMSNMSGYGVKLILPSLLEGLDEKQWRTKRGSIELMGMMAYCAPKQLSQSLPVIIPRLTGVLTDSHAQVRAAANKSLKKFGEVISNPEIQALVPVLLKAMVDPAKAPSALSSLLKTSFVHYIDHSSLALVIPILERGLRERSADTKKKAAQIIGNLASLTDSKDFVPYLSALLPMVNNVLVDPVPEARATAAKALGTLVERLGEVHFPDLVSNLIRTLKADTSGVDRQGAAQGLSEVLSGLGMERLEGLLPDIISNAQSPRSTVREGFMSLLVFLPATFGTRFIPHLPKIIGPILGGLSDTEEYVRDAAMRAGRIIVTNYSSKAIDLLLPELEKGMFDPGWRIRQSSITLVGELLFKVSGISGKAEIEEEGAEAAVAEASRKALTEVLGAERRDRILSALYLARQDSIHIVRQSSIHIWKVLVHNTPRTVREILPELVSQIILLLSSSEEEQEETASRTTIELCRKFGEKIVSEIVSILKSKSTSQDSRTREGVCLMLCDVISNSSETQREGNEDEITSMVRNSLVDEESNVRTAAAKAFDMLQEHLGSRAIDLTIPTLLEALRQPGASSGTALQALKEVMNVRASTVFPVLIPTLIATPMTVFNARALASLVTVAGNALSKRLTVILNALVRVAEELNDDPNDELKIAVSEATRTLLGSINDAEGLNTLMLLLLGWVKHESPKRRVSASNYFAMFCEESKLDSSLYRVDWVWQLVSLLDDKDVSVHTAAWHALDIFGKSIPKDELESLVVPLRRTIEDTGGPGIYVPGFSLPKGVSPFVPIIIAGLTTGSNEQREQAAYAIGDLVERTEEDAIKPFVVPFTGPLIRVATQASTYPPAVKTAILSALTTMLIRIPAFVKPFFPQLQRTFVKSASDPASVVVRTKAAQALGVLMKHQPRVDPVVTELIASARGSDDSIAASMVLALSNVIKSAQQNVGDKARESSLELILDAFKESHEEHYIQSIAALFVTLSNDLKLVRPVVESYLLAGTPSSALSSHCILASLSPDDEEPLFEVPPIFRVVTRSISQKIQESIGTEKPNIARPAREARDLLKKLDPSLYGA